MPPVLAGSSARLELRVEVVRGDAEEEAACPGGHWEALTRQIADMEGAKVTTDLCAAESVGMF